MHLIVDAANVIGSRPDGWWRDRPGAAARLSAELVTALATDRAALAALGRPAQGPAEPGALAPDGRPRTEARPAEPGCAPSSDTDPGDVTVHLVLEGAAKQAVTPSASSLIVVMAPTDGDTTIAELAAQLKGAPVVVVTADQGLRKRVQRVGATVIGPRALRAILDD